MLFRTFGRLNSSANIGLLLMKRSFSVGRIATIDLAAKDGELRVFIVAGEVSGDTIGSRLMASLRNLSPFPVRFAGVGGSMMLKQGLKSLFSMEDIAVMGLWELLPHLNKFRIKLKETVEAAVSFQPHAVVTVDSKGFSFRFLKKLRAIYGHQRLVGPQHFHYVAPSFWAWKGGEERLRRLSEFVDHILCILPFEGEICRLNGLAATFVGHPILEDLLDLSMGKENIGYGETIPGNAEEFRSHYSIPSGSTVISLLPGSRLQEVTRMLPIFLNTVKLLQEYYSELTMVVHVAPNKHVEDYISKVIRNSSLHLLSVPGGSPGLKYNALRASKAALCTSGTVAVEMQISRLPCIVTYRAHFITELVIKYKAKVPYISLPNILLDSPIIPEALFQACKPLNLLPLLRGIIEDGVLRNEQIAAVDKVIELLSPSDKTFCNQIDRDSNHVLPDYTPRKELRFIRSPDFVNFCKLCRQRIHTSSSKHGSDFLHIQCVKLLKTVKHDNHLHDLTLHVPIEKKKYYIGCFCDLCEGERDVNEWLYYCAKCQVAGHLTCGLLGSPLLNEGILTSNHIYTREKGKPPVTDHIEEEYMRALKARVKRTPENEKPMGNLQHFSHKHQLFLFGEIWDQFTKCIACKTSIHGNVYICYDCGFFLPKWCAELPREVHFGFHLQHPLSSLYRFNFCCSYFKVKDHAFLYSCLECVLGVHTKCTFLYEYSSHKSHCHTLEVMVFSPDEHDQALVGKSPIQLMDQSQPPCNACLFPCEGMSLGCKRCDFYLHVGCSLYPHTGKAETHA